MIPSPFYSLLFMITFYNDLCNNSLKTDIHTLTCGSYDWNNGEPPLECCKTFMTANFGKTYELNKCYNQSIYTNFSNMLFQCYEPPNFTKGDTIFLIVCVSLVLLCGLFGEVLRQKHKKKKELKLKQKQIAQLNNNTTYGTTKFN